jgi:hypothetical protein
MVNLPTIEIKELTEYLKDVDNYNDEVFLVGLNDLRFGIAPSALPVSTQLAPFGMVIP